MKQNTNYTTKLSFATNRPRESASLVQAKKSILPESEEPKLRKIRTEANTLFENKENSEIFQNKPEITDTSNSYKQFVTNSAILSANNNQIGNINVICRFRPLNEKEKINSKDICVEFLDEQQCLLKSSTENNNYRFSFDRIFEMSSTQLDIFQGAAQPIIESVLEGFNGTIFAYGQTSSGKTHTMQGDLENIENEGITPRMIRHVFNYFASSSCDTEFTVKVSMFEIYMEKINDLIESNRTNLNIREDKVKGIYIEDLTEHYVCSEEEVFEFIKIGSSNRAVGKTNMNEHSSRSHLIFLMTIHQTNVKTLISKTGKLYLVDLAGSEKISKTGATGMTLEEAKTINKSLTTLGMVINNLTDGKSQHVPYRESKLTRILQESLGGNSKTRLIITCSPSTYNEQESLSTLRFGVRAKKIKNKPKINKEVTVAELKMEIEKLEKLLLLCNDRVQQLESFIKYNNLSLPAEGDFNFTKHYKSLKKEEPIEIKEENENIITETNTEVVYDDNIIDNIDKDKTEQAENIEIIKTDEEVNEKLREDLGENNEAAENENNEEAYRLEQLQQLENEKKLKEITEKYSNVIQQYHILQSDKNILNEKYEEAVNKIQEFSVTFEQKEKLVEELNEMKRKHIELYETIYDLQNKLNAEIEKKKEQEIYVDVRDLSQNAEIQEKCEIENFGEADLNNSSNLIDYVQDNKNLNMQDEKLISKADITINTFFQSNIPEDVFGKLQTIFNLEKTSLDVTEFENELNGLVSAIKTKFNIEIENENQKVSDLVNENNLTQNLEVIQENSFSIGTPNRSITRSNTQKISNFNLLNLSVNNVNSTELTATSSLYGEEEFKKLRNKFKEEKKAIIKTLEEKSEKISHLDYENKDLKNKIKIIELKMTPDDKNYVKKIISLEKSLEQVNHMYHDVVTQKSVLKIENQVLEKKIKKRNEKVRMIESEINDLKEQVKIRDEQLATKYPPQKAKNVPTNVVKVIRGGSNIKASFAITGNEYTSNTAVNQSMVNY